MNGEDVISLILTINSAKIGSVYRRVLKSAATFDPLEPTTFYSHCLDTRIFDDQDFGHYRSL